MYTNGKQGKRLWISHLEIKRRFVERAPEVQLTDIQHLRESDYFTVSLHSLNGRQIACRLRLCKGLWVAGIV